MKKLVTILLLFISSLAFCASLKPSELAAIQVVEQFAQGCVMSFPHPDKFTEWLAQPGFRKLSSTEAKEYLGGYPGSAWSAQLGNSRFVLTSIDGSACNIFANDLDETMTKNLIVGFLDYLKTQGATYQSKNVTPVAATANQTSTSYAVSMDGQVVMNLILTIAAPGNGKFQVALTASKATT